MTSSKITIVNSTKFKHKRNNTIILSSIFDKNTIILSSIFDKNTIILSSIFDKKQLNLEPEYNEQFVSPFKI